MKHLLHWNSCKCLTKCHECHVMPTDKLYLTCFTEINQINSLKILRMTKPIFKKLYPATSRERGRERKGSENGNKFTSKGD